MRSPLAFTYAAPPELALRPGCLVRVPFGPRDVYGVVVEERDAPSGDYARPVKSLVEDAPLVSPERLELARWIADYYLSPLYDALRLMLPPRPWPSRARPDAGGPPLLLRRIASREELRARADARQRRAPRQAALIRELVRRGTLDAADARRKHGAPAVRAVAASGLASLAPEPLPAPVASPLPTAAQRAAVAAVAHSLDGAPDAQRTWLLHGVTGSGKTEVYLQAVAHCIASGRRAIVLVPEQSLTPQTVERFASRFPGRVGVLQSGLTASRRAAEWRRIARGERDVVVGPRSALFAPVDRLGLIVIDEEHEWTYKQEELPPLYHARDAAERLAALTGAVVLLGSATPDVVTWRRSERGEIGRLELPDRLEPSGATSELAQVSVVDMREELRAGNRGIFSRPLREALLETLAAGRQAVLFLNRRGSATVVSCRSCGQAMRCVRCTTPLTFHSSPRPPKGGASAPQPPQGGAGTLSPFRGTGSRGRLLCHNCGHSRQPPARCPACGSPRIRYLGLGAERVEDEVAALAPPTLASCGGTATPPRTPPPTSASCGRSPPARLTCSSARRWSRRGSTSPPSTSSASSSPTWG